MKILGIAVFYLSLLLGVGMGLIFAFQFGRLGITQIVAWLRALPEPEPIGKEDALFVLETQHVPTSLFQLLAALTGFGGLASFLAATKYFWRRLSPPLLFFAGIE